MKNKLLYIWLLLPVVVYSQGRIIAHRGASTVAPENTLVAFEKAIELGADYIELDLRLSADDSLMVIHDETLDRTTSGAGKVEDHSYAQLKELSAGYEAQFGSSFLSAKIPTLLEVLQFARGRVKVCIDMKNVPEAMVISQIEQAGMVDEVFLMSYNFDKLKRIESVARQFKTVLIKNLLTSIDIELAAEAGFFAVSGSWISNPLLINKAYNKGLEFWVGIITDPAKAETLFDLGVDAVVTNHPQLMGMSRSPMFRVFPNPFDDYITIQLKFPLDTEVVEIRDSDGKIIYRFQEPYKSFLHWHPGERIRKGWYFLIVVQKNEVMFEKILYSW